MEDSELLNKPRRLSLIDVSSEDDSLIDSFTGDLNFSDDQVNRSLELFGGAAANKLDAVPENVELTEQAIQPTESVEPVVAKKKGKYNLRESIAWNSDFLTGQGVLDAEELSSMIDNDKSETRMLPGIQEEIYRSTDTISTLESDTLTFESADVNLFEDLRASILRSSNASKVADGRVKVGSGVAEGKSTCVSKGLVASQDKARPTIASKKTSIDVQRQGVLKRQASRCPQVSQSVSTSGGSSASLLKRPKVLGKANPSSEALSKRASTGGALLKVGKDTVKSTTGRGAPISKAALSSRIVPKTSHLGASPADSREETSSSIDSSGSTTLNNFSTKADSRTTDNTPSSGPTSKKSPRIELRNKSQSEKPVLSSNMMHVKNISPAASVSECSSESSRASLDTISLKSGSVDFDAPLIMDLQNHSKSLNPVRHETQATGLRLPSPKIGFFDGVKSAGSTPNGKKQPHPLFPSTVPKFGAGNVSLSGAQSKEKAGKLQPVRTKEVSKKLYAQQRASIMKPTSSGPVQHSLNASEKVPTPSRNSITAKVNNRVNPKSGTENQLKDEKSGTEAHGIDIKEQQNCSTEKKAGIANSENEATLELKDSPAKGVKVTTTDGESASLCESLSTSAADVTICLEEITKVAASETHSVKSDLDSLNMCKERKELQIEEQIHDLSRQVGDLVMGAETQEMLDGDSISTSDADVVIASGELSEDAASEPHSVKLDSDSLNMFKERKESQIKEQVHDLSRQVGALVVGLETQERLDGDSISTSGADVVIASKELCEVAASEPHSVKQIEEQVHDLSRQPGALVIGEETQERLDGDSISTSDADVVITSKELCEVAASEPHSVKQIEEQVHDLSRQPGALVIGEETQERLDGDPISTSDADVVITSKELCEVAASEPHSVKADSDSLNILKGRNKSQIEEQVHNLSRQAGALVIGTETQQMIDGESISTSDADVVIASEELSHVAASEPHSVTPDSDSLNIIKERKESEIEEHVHDLSRQVGALVISSETEQMPAGESLPSNKFQQ